MNFNAIPEWQNIEIQSLNRMGAHSPWHTEYNLSLDGKWKFLLFDDPVVLPAGFSETDFDDSTWREINVPGCWQLQGEGSPVYTNWAYPFTDEPGSHLITPCYGTDTNYGSRMNPPRLPDKIPVGVYRRSFEMPEHFLGKRIVLRFGGVESGFYVWVNGRPVGYSQDSKLAAEFDVTRYTFSGVNQITVQVMNFTDATWLEDQDYWHLSGIFRPVSLIAKPRLHIEDVKIRAEANGDMQVDVKVTRLSGFGETRVRLHIYDPDGNIIYKEKRSPACNMPGLYDKNAPMPGWARFIFHIDNPRVWSPETPNLYRLHLALLDPSSTDAADREKTTFGFRTVKIENGILMLNGQRVIVRGVNRHEHCIDTGRYVSPEQMKKEVLLMKSMNINAVRTCHYPDSPYFYDLCDAYGIMVVCETNLETHGSGALLTNDPEWAEAFLQRARRMAVIHKNHPSIIIWSLGNESGFGPNHAAMAAWLRSYDRTRPVQYESGDPDATVSDIRCPMYPTPERITQMLTEYGDNRPIILCEYAYQILNSGGGMKHFRELTERYPRFQGGFIWDFQDKALWQTDENGKRFVAYGGDFFEPVVEPFEPRFMCMNGIVTAELELKPSGEEAKYIYSPVFIERKKGNVYTLKNRYMFTALEPMKLMWEAYSAGEIIASGEMTLPDLAPMTDADFALDTGALTGSDTYINMTFGPWKQQFSLHALPYIPRKERYLPASYDDSRGTYTIKGQDFELCIMKQTGAIVSLIRGGREYMLSGLTEIATRGLSGVNAQSGWGLYDVWEAFTQQNCMRRLVSLNISSLTDGRVRIERMSRLTSRTIEGAAVDVELHLLISGNGKVQVSARFTLSGIASVERLGLTWVLPPEFDTVTWFGRGPGESYPDRKESQMMGLYTRSVKDMAFNFTPPAENGGREDTRFVSFSAGDGAKLTFTSDSPIHFDARNMNVSDLRESAHTHETPVRRQVIVHIDAAHSGIGGNMAWSTEMEDCYTVKPGEYVVNFEFEALRAQENP